MQRRSIIPALLFVVGSLLPSPTLAIDPPNHSFDFGYYFVDGRYGDFRSEVNCYTNLYYAWAWRNYPTDQDWRPLMTQSLTNAVAEGRKIHLNANQERAETSIDEVLDVAAPFWNSITRIEFADEPDWTKAETENRIQQLKSKLQARGLAVRPIGVVYTQTQVLTSNAILASNLDWVGIEAYVNPPGSPDSQTNINALNSYVNQAKARIPANKNIVIVMQAYARNGAWTNIQTLKDLQEPTYLLAKDDPRVIALTMFSYGRPSGTREHMELAEVHKDISRAMGLYSCGGGPTTAPPASPTSIPIPTDNCPDTVEFVCGIDGQSYINRCVAEQRYGMPVYYEGLCGGTPTDQPDPSSAAAIHASVKNISQDSISRLVASAKDGDILEFTGQVVVQGNTPLAVDVQAALPYGIEYINQSTRINGQTSEEDISNGAVHLTAVDPAAPSYVSFRAKVTTSTSARSFISQNLGVQSLIVTMTASDANGHVSNDSAFVTVEQASPVVGVSVVGQDLTRQTKPKNYIQTQPGNLLAFTITITPKTDIPEVVIQNTLPDGLTSVVGKTTLNGQTTSDDLFTSTGLTFAGARANEPIVVTFWVKVGTTAIFNTGTTALINNVSVDTGAQLDVIVQFPVQVTNGGIGGIGQISTGSSFTLFIVSGLALFCLICYGIHYKIGHLRKHPAVS